MKSSSDSTTQANNTASVRLDRWLWATRFFKTRGLAAGAIKGGKITLNNDKANKPSKTVKVGDTVSVRKDAYQYTLSVTGLAEKRGSADVARTLYSETPASVVERERVAELIKANAQGIRRDGGRPEKRERRELDRFKRQNPTD